MDIISLDAAEAMTGISRRTLWRRVADGALASGEKDARGRTTVALGGGGTYSHPRAHRRRSGR